MDIKFIPTPTQQRGIDAQLALENEDRIAQKLQPWTEVELLLDHLSVISDSFYHSDTGSTLTKVGAAVDEGLITTDELKALLDSKK